MNSVKNKLPYFVPVFFILFISVGLASFKTLLIGLGFSISVSIGIMKGNEINWKDKEIEFVKEKYIRYLFVISILVIFFQILIIGDIPLLNSSAKSSLNPTFTSLTYIIGIPTSIYLFMKGKKYSVIFPFIVVLYGYRTPFIVSLLSTILYSIKEKSKKVIIILVGLLFLGILVATFSRGYYLNSLFIRIQATTSVLDSLTQKVPFYGEYLGGLQWAGIRSYLIGGYSPRTYIAGLLGIRHDVTITGTLLGGMYIDWGIFSLIEGYILGLYYGMLSNGNQLLTNSIFYATLSYGIVGIETGILDLPVYLLFLAGFWIILRGKYKIKVLKIAE